MNSINADSKGKLESDIVGVLHVVSTRLELVRGSGTVTEEEPFLEDVARRLVDCHVSCQKALGPKEACCIGI